MKSLIHSIHALSHAQYLTILFFILFHMCVDVTMCPPYTKPSSCTPRPLPPSAFDRSLAASAPPTNASAGAASPRCFPAHAHSMVVIDSVPRSRPEFTFCVSLITTTTNLHELIPAGVMVPLVRVRGLKCHLTTQFSLRSCGRRQQSRVSSCAPFVPLVSSPLSTCALLPIVAPMSQRKKGVVHHRRGVVTFRVPFLVLVRVAPSAGRHGARGAHSVHNMQPAIMLLITRRLVHNITTATTTTTTTTTTNNNNNNNNNKQQTTTTTNNSNNNTSSPAQYQSLPSPAAASAGRVPRSSSA